MADVNSRILNMQLNMICDISIFCEGSVDGHGRAGEWFVALNILKRLKLYSTVKIDLIFRPDLVLNAFLFQKSELREFDFCHKIPQSFLPSLYWKVVLFHKSIFHRNFLRKPFALLMYIIQRYYARTYNKYYTPEILKNKQALLTFIPLEFPQVVMQSDVKRFTFLHDAIPFVLPEFFESDFVSKFKKTFESYDQEDCFFCNSEYTKKDCAHFSSSVCEKNTKISYLAASASFCPVRDFFRINDCKKKYNIPEKKYVFSLCTIEPRKNLVRTVSTFISFINKHQITDLCFVLGGGHWDSFLEELKKHEVSWNPEQIIRAGYIDDEDLPVLYSNAEWFVYTSQYEGFGLPPLEAMQCGCPVITSNNSSLPEVVGDAGIMIDWDSDEQHVKAYEDYYFHPELREENSRKGLERAKLFSWEKTVDEMVEFMKDKCER